MALSTGARVGPYEILAPLGQGGMGEVYKARDTKLERLVALKTLPALFAADPDRLARFEREAKLLASLNHPNIAQIYDAGQYIVAGSGTAGQSIAFLTMELVEGDDLAARIEQGPLALADALPIAREIAAALDAAHAQGIVHRDLKPANIKIRADGTVKVGLQLAKRSAPRIDLLRGHSPALRRGRRSWAHPGHTRPHSARAGTRQERRQARDIWAFGCVLYEMLTAGGSSAVTIDGLSRSSRKNRTSTRRHRRRRRLLRRASRIESACDIGDAWDPRRPPGSRGAGRAGGR